MTLWIFFPSSVGITSTMAINAIHSSNEGAVVFVRLHGETAAWNWPSQLYLRDSSLDIPKAVFGEKLFTREKYENTSVSDSDFKTPGYDPF